MSKQEYSISVYQDRDYDSLQLFFSNTWRPPQLERGAKWLSWNIKDQPNISEETPTVVLAWHDQLIVGVMFALPTDIKLGGDEKPMTWVHSLFVDKKHRRNRLALKMFKELSYHYSAILGSGQSPTQKKLQTNHDWLCVASVNQKIKLFPNGRYLFDSLYAAPHKFLKRLFAMTYSCFFGRPQKHELKISKTDKFGQYLDDFWKVNKVNYTWCQKRDSRTLNWRFTTHPYLSYCLFEAYKQNGEYGGYAVGRKEDGDFYIVDIFTSEEDEYIRKALIYALEKEAIKLNCIRLVSRSICPPLESALRRCGFLGSFLDQTFQVMTNDKQHFPTQGWYITGFDSDLDR